MAHAISLPENSRIIRVLAADRTPMNSQLLADALARDKKFFVVESAFSSGNLLASIAKEGPHVAVLSAQLDGDPKRGYELTKTLRANHPEIRVVLLLDSSDREAVVQAFRAGARGVFSRTGSFEALAKCIRSVYQGQVWANSRELVFVLESLSANIANNFPQLREMNSLSKRERDVVCAVLEGMTNREIALHLKLTEHTVKNYLFRIFDKLGVSSRVELVLHAFSIPSSSIIKQRNATGRSPLYVVARKQSVSPKSVITVRENESRNQLQLHRR